MTITLLSTSDITTSPGESNGVLEKKVIRRRWGVQGVREPKIRNNTCITCGCASGECECPTSF